MVYSIGALKNEEIFDDSILIFPDTEYKFTKTDGYIEFCRFVINLFLDESPNQEFKESILKLYRTLNRLQDVYTHFDGKTSKDFEEYTKKISKIYETNCFDIDVNIIKAKGKQQIEEMLTKYSNRKNIYCFFYEDEEDFNENFKEEVFNNLNSLKMNKEHKLTNNDISFYLTKNDYHEHIVDAINVLTQTLVYAFNCYSFKNKETLYEDIYYIDRYIDYAKNIISRMKFVL